MSNEVAVTGGRINGLAVRGELRAFLGIPFAAPPLGIRRWRAPEPLAPWDGTRDATRFAPRPVQPVIAPVGDLPSVQAKLFFPPARYGQSEDCLYLNVWTAARPGDQRPVMVWIYGGGFRAGDTANPLYNGEALARALNVVVHDFDCLSRVEIRLPRTSGTLGRVIASRLRELRPARSDRSAAVGAR